MNQPTAPYEDLPVPSYNPRMTATRVQITGCPEGKSFLWPTKQTANIRIYCHRAGIKYITRKDKDNPEMTRVWIISKPAQFGGSADTQP
jgi:hypothetical protein